MNMTSTHLARAIAHVCILLLLFAYAAGAYNDDLVHKPAQEIVKGSREPLVLQHRNAILSSSNTTANINFNSTFFRALHLVEIAQVEARRRNARLLENPRRNTYEFRRGASAQSTSIQDDGTIDKAIPDSTGVNITMADAAAIVAETLASNGTSSNISHVEKRASSYWMENMVQNGASPYAPSGYKVWRNVKDYGAVGDGVHDDTDAVNRAISDQNRCGQACGSTSTLQAVVYFPAGSYLISRSIVAYYHTQIIGDPTNLPIIKVAPSFVGLGVISSDVYIEGGDGASWYINQSNFYRQVRNFIIDMTNGPLNDFIAGIHWQVAQATSLQNIQFKMSVASGNNQQGIYMENGSGGFMGDLEFTGGTLGAYVGNQQFTVRNLKFFGQLTRALEIHWDWGWTWKSVQIENTAIGVIMRGPSDDLGSALFIDSTFKNVPIGIQLQAPGNSFGRITFNLFNVAVTNVPLVVKLDTGKALLAGTGGSQTIKAWGLGKRYDSDDGEATGVWQTGASYDRLPSISPTLLKSPGNSASGFYERSKPQYESVPASQFINIKLSPYNAAGNGATDDTATLNAALAESAKSGRILWIPAGVYIVTDTITVPPGAKVVGQSWTQIMGSGSRFSNIDKPYPVVRVGNVGDVGSVELQDLLFTVRGATAGAIVLQWNIHESSPGSAAMWDCHVRVGGAAGSNLQVSNCPKLTGKIDPKCIAGSMLVHITSKASAYFENTWFWVADHDLDIPAQTQIDVFVGRGVLIESSGPVWLYGTGSEHCVLYQYQLYNAANVFMGMIQTESPYFQASPPAPEPFALSSVFPLDPTFAHCEANSPTCAISWAVRIMNSANVYIYGAGLYSWFQKYSQACLDTDNCQDRIFEISSSSSIWIYNLITKASVEMISPNGGLSVFGKDNKVSFCNIIMAWMGSAGSDGGSSSGGAVHRSPASATVIPFSVTTVAPTATFTVSGPVVSQIDSMRNEGNQNLPPGPGDSQCLKCDLGRLITSTCCGVGGGISNPIEIGAGYALPRPMFLPKGFIPNQRVTGVNGRSYLPGLPLINEIIIPIGTVFPFIFTIPPGLSLSDTWSPNEEANKKGNGTLYLPSDFWKGQQHTIQCDYPCTVIFPPLTTTTTWDPQRITIPMETTTITTDPPPYTTQLIRVSKVTIASEKGSQATKTVKPSVAPKPLCFDLGIAKLCPPTLTPFPPVVSIPSVTIRPIPPGGKPGPTAMDNLPTSEEAQSEAENEEDDDDDDDAVCPLVDWLDEEDDYDLTYPGSGKDNQPEGFKPPAAGTGKPATVTVTATTVSTRVVTVDATVTVTVAPPPQPTKKPEPPPSEPTPNTPNDGWRMYTCFWDGTKGRQMWAPHGKQFCADFAGQELNAMPGADEELSWRAWGYQWYPVPNYAWTYVMVVAKPGCKFKIDKAECEEFMEKISWTCDKYGGNMDDNCSSWALDPGSMNWGERKPPDNTPEGWNT